MLSGLNIGLFFLLGYSNITLATLVGGVFIVHVGIVIVIATPATILTVIIIVNVVVAFRGTFVHSQAPRVPFLHVLSKDENLAALKYLYAVLINVKINSNSGSRFV